ncbi:Golgi-associated plant pathogenesis-related 1-like [Brachionus plicatilis]|uniref:Golgi-associated plant pathogenesis-related 1-like n=1 Tax=Brachionus plicatilis TaxID=10195 RepID=A0A3M7SAU8_BRAPC|nr:Golgi-associated plant pathogenesis-related 1-like [Brachionus plicatilis]
MRNLFLIIGILSVVDSILSQTCSVMYNVDFYGNDLFSIPTIVAEINSCCQLCAITNGCRAWTFLPLNRVCWLKNGIGSVKNVSPGPIFSGIVQYPSPSYTTFPVTTQSYPSPSYTTFPVTTQSYPSPSYTTFPVTTQSYPVPGTTLSTLPFSTTSIFSSFTTDSTTSTVQSTNSLDDCNAQFNAAALEAHNSYRDLHHAPPLTLDPKVIDVASTYADKLGYEIKSLVHSGTPGYGENLAVWYSSAETDCSAMARKFVKMWYDEISLYNYNNPGFTKETGHFTQVVWKSSTKLGCGISINDGKTFGVCNYTPPGNYIGQFAQNVLPK